jgi:hypothetical protein
MSERSSLARLPGEEEGVLLVPKAVEMLYYLRQRPDWAREM